MRPRRQRDLDALAFDDRAAEDLGVGAGSLVEGDRGVEPALVTAGDGVQFLALFVPNVKGRVCDAGLGAVYFEGYGEVDVGMCLFVFNRLLPCFGRVGGVGVGF